METKKFSIKRLIEEFVSTAKEVIYEPQKTILVIVLSIIAFYLTSKFEGLLFENDVNLPSGYLIFKIMTPIFISFTVVYFQKETLQSALQHVKPHIQPLLLIGFLWFFTEYLLSELTSWIISSNAQDFITEGFTKPHDDFEFDLISFGVTSVVAGITFGIIATFISFVALISATYIIVKQTDFYQAVTFALNFVLSNILAFTVFFIGLFILLFLVSLIFSIFTAGLSIFVLFSILTVILPIFFAKLIH
ncbi:MAG: hypothetical protein NZT61_01515 [Deltaproteobacteria bacterium]|nr:hypothetical protein [Deltaproteobacteria bacterium]MCX7953127.1 hypothetical protein [Deltaproteobacteria bacterium]